ncbi:hypothetical protein chiPu_0032113, partial [Chiloscyllium punctatum]|nr:hypothetical protein [Chiloscyllium punctatum]
LLQYLRQGKSGPSLPSMCSSGGKSWLLPVIDSDKTPGEEGEQRAEETASRAKGTVSLARRGE